jgi:2-polyprenyl-3-methyl-5-hydroxy-6-metoxy-1,4-benzoquinol methylase
MVLNKETGNACLPALRELMRRYRTDALCGVDSRQFRDKIDSLLQLNDHKMEGFGDAARQRDLSVRFHWGHNHDFGTFAVEGRMGDRHLNLLSVFMDQFKALPRDLTGKRVLDIGCWTGGTSLLLCAMGAEVVAIEEVRKYVDALTYLKSAFNVQNLEVRNMSLYDCNVPEFQDAFDIILFAGVLYHVTDPILALRIVFNSLRDGGSCLLETAALASDKMMVAYEGPDLFHSGTREQMNRGGWNWFIPSPVALKAMMHDAGFSKVEGSGVGADQRTFAVGTRTEHRDIMRGGLSVRGIR